MKTGKILIALTVLSSLFFTSCSDDDGYSLGKYWVGIATVENQEGGPYFFFDLDDGTRMWTAATGLPYYSPANGQRIIANYTILSDKSSGSSYDHDVRLNDVYQILTKDMVAITSENNETLSNDPITIKDIWVGGDHLNVEFVFAGYNKVHFINLGRDASKDYNDGKIHLEFRHNAYDDSPSYKMWGMASFRLEPLQAEGTESLTLVIHTKEYGSDEDKIYELTYNFSTQSSSGRTFILEQNAGEIK